MRRLETVCDRRTAEKMCRSRTARAEFKTRQSFQFRAKKRKRQNFCGHEFFKSAADRRVQGIALSRQIHRIFQRKIL